MLTALVAACTSWYLAEPALGIASTAISLIALVRTLVIGRQLQRVGMPFPASEKIAVFGISTLLVLGAMGIGLMTLMAIAVVGGLALAILLSFGPPDSPPEKVALAIMGVAFWLGVAVGPLAAGICFLWKTWPR